MLSGSLTQNKIVLSKWYDYVLTPSTRDGEQRTKCWNDSIRFEARESYDEVKKQRGWQVSVCRGSRAWLTRCARSAKCLASSGVL